MSEIRETPPKPRGLFHEAMYDIASTSKNWWLLLVTGVTGVVIAVGHSVAAID